MFRSVSKALKTAALCGAALTVGLQAPLPAGAVSATTTQLQLFPGTANAIINGASSSLEEPAAIINDHFYVPVRWLSDTLELKLSWVESTRTIGLLTPKAYMQFDEDKNTISVNGIVIPFEGTAQIRNDRLLVRLSWLAQYIDAAYRYDEASHSVVIRHLGTTSSAYKESDLVAEDSQPNSRPIAKFAFDKTSYRLGEPIQYIDLSYDPDAEGLPNYEWTGKQDAFYEPGTYSVTLRVKDGKGNPSEPFTKTITVTDTPYLSRTDYPYYTKPSGAVFSFDPGVLSVKEKEAGQGKLLAPVVVRQPEDRPLIRGMWTSPVMSKGFLYQAKVNGKARLYPSYVNGMEGAAQVTVLLRNRDESKPVKVTTSRKSSTPSSIYNTVHSYRTLEDFMTASSNKNAVTIQPGTSVIYTASTKLSSGQAFQGVYDIETDGELDVSYIMAAAEEQPYNLGKYEWVNRDEASDISGTFKVSEVAWQIDARGLKEPESFGVGDSQIEPVLTGIDSRTGQESAHPGYAGVHYRIQLDTAGRNAIALHPRGGFFQGSIRVNGQSVELPAAGLTGKETVLLSRTMGSQSVIIELMASERTQLPLDLIVIPLSDKSKS